LDRPAIRHSNASSVVLATKGLEIVLKGFIVEFTRVRTGGSLLLPIPTRSLLCESSQMKCWEG
jgi:hypothetical protein